MKTFILTIAVVISSVAVAGPAEDFNTLYQAFLKAGYGDRSTLASAVAKLSERECLKSWSVEQKIERYGETVRIFLSKGFTNKSEHALTIAILACKSERSSVEDVIVKLADLFKELRSKGYSNHVDVLRASAVLLEITDE